MVQFALFDSPIGRCGLVWSHKGITGLQLPEQSEAATAERVRHRFPAALEAPPPGEAAAAIAAVADLLAGNKTDLSFIALDMDDLPPFHRRVYEDARRIPAGETRSYGDIAIRLQAPGAARAVGQALGHNPFALIVPCHRVLAADGSMHGFSAHGGVATKRRLLEIEGASPRAPVLF
jgi:methylated-DNA-[protein]-cysteine S-methyltransferase